MKVCKCGEIMSEISLLPTPEEDTRFTKGFYCIACKRSMKLNTVTGERKYYDSSGNPEKTDDRPAIDPGKKIETKLLKCKCGSMMNFIQNKPWHESYMEIYCCDTCQRTAERNTVTGDIDFFHEPNDQKRPDVDSRLNALEMLVGATLSEMRASVRALREMIKDETIKNSINYQVLDGRTRNAGTELTRTIFQAAALLGIIITNKENMIDTRGMTDGSRENTVIDASTRLADLMLKAREKNGK